MGVFSAGRLSYRRLSIRLTDRNRSHGKIVDNGYEVDTPYPDPAIRGGLRRRRRADANADIHTGRTGRTDVHADGRR